jgi:hypothetical protein
MKFISVIENKICNATVLCEIYGKNCEAGGHTERKLN